MAKPNELKGAALKREADQIILSWGLTDVTYKLTGNRATITTADRTVEVMRWDLCHQLNQLGAATL